jgi:mandelate racemase
MGAREGLASSTTTKLTVERVTARPLIIRLERPIVARIARISEWPVILVDLHTEEGIVGRSYLEPYTVRTMKYLVPALVDAHDQLVCRHDGMPLRVAGC